MSTLTIPQPRILNKEQIAALSSEISTIINSDFQIARTKAKEAAEQYTKEVVTTDHVILELQALKESAEALLIEIDYANMSDSDKNDYWFVSRQPESIDQAIRARISNLSSKLFPILDYYCWNTNCEDIINSYLVTREIADRDTIVNEVVAKVKATMETRFNFKF